MLGCGIQGKANVKMIGAALENLEQIYIYDISPEAMVKLIEVCQPEVNAKIVKCGSYEELVKKSEVIISALPIVHHPNPPVKNEWVAKGQTLVCLDCLTVYEDAVYKRADKYYLDSIAQHELLAGYGYYPYGLPNITGETGAMAGGIVPGREKKGELVIINNVGMAVEDIMCARMIFDRAIENDLGIKLPLWSSTKSLK
jgi:ornithine cyclodeaminase/alanine dehydrogenase